MQNIPNNSQNSTPSEIWTQLQNAKKIICCIDSRFDFDSYGSALTMWHMVKEHLGKEITLTYCKSITDEYKEILSEYFDLSKIQFDQDPSQIDFSQYDLLITMDAGDIKHVSEEREFQVPSITKINIDHHATNNFFGDFNYVFVTTSTCSVIYNFFQELGLNLNKTTASLLVMGHLTDSGFLTYPLVTSEDMDLASKLLRIADARMFDFVYKLSYNDSYETTIMNKITYKNLVVDYQNKVAYSYISLQDLKDHNITREVVNPTSSVDKLKTIGKVDFVFLVKEKEDAPGHYSVSLRSRDPNYDVSKIAEKFGGGGHKTASGCRLYDIPSIEEAIQTILKAKY